MNDPMSQDQSGEAERPFLVDVSRLIWRLWTGRIPTGIDRVCMAYVRHFGDRAKAVVQRNGVRQILSDAHSDELFGMLHSPLQSFRSRFSRFAIRAFLNRGDKSSGQGRIYLNVGHTGLDEPGLPQWIDRLGLRPVFLVHDLIPLTHPELCRAGATEQHLLRIDAILRCASGIICNSAVTEADLAAHAQMAGLSVPPSVVAWIAGHDIPRTVTASRLKRPYFLAVGTIEGRKNHILLLQIWKRMAERLGDAAPLLVVAGQRGWEADHALAMLDRAPALKGHVIERNDVNDHELVRLVAGAQALLMPSFVEGFGIPVIEALQLGTPVIASDLPVFREIAGDIPLYLDNLDGPAWERAILGFDKGGEPSRQALLLQDWQPPNWSEHFAIVEDWLETLPLDRGANSLAPSMPERTSRQQSGGSLV